MCVIFFSCRHFLLALSRFILATIPFASPPPFFSLFPYSLAVLNILLCAFHSVDLFDIFYIIGIRGGRRTSRPLAHTLYSTDEWQRMTQEINLDATFIASTHSSRRPLCASFVHLNVRALFFPSTIQKHKFSAPFDDGRHVVNRTLTLEIVVLNSLNHSRALACLFVWHIVF